MPRRVFLHVSRNRSQKGELHVTYIHRYLTTVKPSVFTDQEYLCPRIFTKRQSKRFLCKRALEYERKSLPFLWWREYFNYTRFPVNVSSWLVGE